MTTRGIARRAGMTLGRSFFPFMALVIVLGATLWGPWISLALVLVMWRVVGRIA